MASFTLPFFCKKGKGPTLISHHKPRTAAVAALCVTDEAGVQPIDCILSLHKRARSLAAKQPHAALVCRLMASTLVRKPCNYMDYYSFTKPKGMEG